MWKTENKIWLIEWLSIPYRLKSDAIHCLTALIIDYLLMDMNTQSATTLPRLNDDSTDQWLLVTLTHKENNSDGLTTPLRARLHPPWVLLMLLEEIRRGEVRPIPKLSLFLSLLCHHAVLYRRLQVSFQAVLHNVFCIFYVYYKLHQILFPSLADLFTVFLQT